MARKPKKETLKSGRVVWRARGVDVGKDPVTSKRIQVTITRDLKKDVEAELARIGYQVSKGTYQRPWDGLVPEMCDAYEAFASFEKEANTQLSIKNALKPARVYFARYKARTVTREHIENYRDHLLTAGRKRGGQPGTGLSPRTVNMALQQLSAAFDLAERDGRVEKNPCRWVKRARQVPAQRPTWGEGEIQAFIAAAAADRLYACWLLSLLGFRRSEVLGLKWADVSFTEGTITVRRARVLVDGEVIEKAPKSARGHRTLPLFQPVTGALEALYQVQVAEKAAAGAAYTGDVEDGYVACDELGAPLHPERISDEFHRIAAGLVRIRLHDTRASVNGYLERLGVPDSVRAMWLGHTIEINRAAYLRASAADLAEVSDALGGLFQPGVTGM